MGSCDRTRLSARNHQVRWHRGLTWVLCHESGELSLSRLLVRPLCPLELCRSFTEVLRGRHNCLLSALL